MHRNRMSSVSMHDSTCTKRCDSVWGALMAFLIVYIVIIIVLYVLGYCQCCSAQAGRANLMFWCILFTFFIVLLIFLVSNACASLRR